MWERKNYEMNKCLSLVHLTSTIGPESSGLGQSNSRFQGRVYNVNDHRRSYIPWVAKWAGEKVLERFVGVSYVGGMRIPKRGVGCARDRSGAITDNLRITTAARDGGGRLPKTRELPLESRPSDRRLSKSLSCSMQAIQQRRVRLS